jgi:glycosyltransferase involved in cell wall biosynthesis
MNFPGYSKKINIGIVANEFFEENLTRLGGFGWAAKHAALTLNKTSQFEPFLLTSDLDDLKNNQKPVLIDDIPLYNFNKHYIKNFYLSLKLRVDILLTIDYRTSYNPVLKSFPSRPIITWVRDPRPPDDVNKLLTLKIPGCGESKPKGIHDNPTQRLADFQDRRWPLRRKVILANKMPHMKNKLEETYGLPPSGFVLPNPNVVNYDETVIQKSKKPIVIFLGRLDPVKRPWLFVELSRHFPEVKFLVLGKRHFHGEGSWKPVKTPENLKFLGHLTGKDKYKILSKAWMMVNTSIHEESPVSVFECLAFETPVISYEDWGDIVRRFGITIGQHLGDGYDGMPDLIHAVKELLENHENRYNLGKAGRDYVKKTHNDHEFISHLSKIVTYLQSQ